MDNKPGGLSEPAISGVNSSTVAITGGTITLNGPGIQMVGGTLIIGPEAKVLGIVPQSNAYGAGFVFENGEASVKGDPVLPVDLTIPEECTLNVPAGTSLTVPKDVTLTVDGSLAVNGSLTGGGAIRVETGGSITGTGDISGTVQHKLTKDMVVIEKDSYTYTGEAITPKVTIKGYTQDTDYMVAYKNNTDAGETATITIKPTGTGGLYGDAVTMYFTIEKVKPTIELKIAEKATYNGQPVKATATVNGVGEDKLEATLVYQRKEGDSWTDLEGAPTDAGDYKVKATFAENTNYTAVETTAEFTIEKAKPTIELTVLTDAVYDGKAKTATAEVTGVKGETAELEAVITYYSDKSMAEGTEVDSPTNAGTYYVKATFAENTNYTAVEDTKEFTIGKVEPTIELNIAEKATYNGQPVEATATVKGGRRGRI